MDSRRGATKSGTQSFDSKKSGQKRRETSGQRSEKEKGMSGKRSGKRIGMSGIQNLDSSKKKRRRKGMSLKESFDGISTSRTSTATQTNKTATINDPETSTNS